MKSNQKIMKWVPIIAIILLFIMVALNASAQEASTEESNEAEKSSHRLGLFLGNTQDGSEHGFSIGLEYEYQWSRLFGVGVMASEFAYGDFDAWVVGLPFFLHPYAGWFFLVMPGLGHENEETGFVFRAGVGYDFDIVSHWSLAPEFNIEFPEEGDSKLIYGLTVSREF